MEGKTDSNIGSFKLLTPFTIWYKYSDESNTSKTVINQDEYSGMVKQLAEVNTIEEFFDQYQYLKKPDDIKSSLEISIFRKGIKPMWEEEANKVGGKVTLKIKKEMSNPIWDEIVLRFIGGSFPDIDNSEVNGVMYSVKREFNIIQIWFRNYNGKFNVSIANSVRNIFSIPDGTELDVRAFNKPKTYNNSGYNNYYQKK